ncbi:MAG: hypothetical protein ACK5LC_08290 [Coprobacillaceae bacterium]
MIKYRNIILILILSFITIGCSNENDKVETEIIDIINQWINDIHSADNNADVTINHVYYIFEENVTYQFEDIEKVAIGDCYIINIDATTSFSGITNMFILMDENYKEIIGTSLGFVTDINKTSISIPTIKVFIDNKEVPNYKKLENVKEISMP